MISYEEFVKKAGSCDEPTFEIVRAAAKRKLDVIISRFGDENGERLTDGYLLQLMLEEYRSQRITDALFSVFTHSSDNRKSPATA